MKRRTSKQDSDEDAGLPRLLVTAAEAQQQIADRVALGNQILEMALTDLPQLDQAKAEQRKWSDYNRALLRRLFSAPGPSEEYGMAGYSGSVYFSIGELSDYELLVRGRDELRDLLTDKIRQLESIMERLPLYEAVASVPTLSDGGRVLSAESNRVFLVHGQDVAAQQSVARFIENVGLHPVMLTEEPAAGEVLIEKLESHSDVRYAIVLLTPDDIGGVRNSDPQNLKPRARQNVILELGFFCAKLGRANVCPLYAEGVELPSDYHGVQYIPLDDNDGWRLKLAKQLKKAGFSIKADALI